MGVEKLHQRDDFNPHPNPPPARGRGYGKVDAVVEIHENFGLTTYKWADAIRPYGIYSPRPFTGEGLGERAVCGVSWR